MSRTLFTDRSRIQEFQACPRKRWLTYHEARGGIVPQRESLPLAVGKAVHKGLETLLRGTQNTIWDGDQLMVAEPLEDAAVAAALADFAPHRRAIALDLAEESALAVALDPKDSGFPAQLVATATELGMSPDDPALAELLGRQRNAAAEFDEWLYSEQAALVEGMVRAYSRRRLRPLLEEFEVLEVEREGQWLLHKEPEDGHLYDEGGDIKALDDYELWFMSRPDALLRSRSDNSLYLLSYKTAATWDVRKARDAEHDMQGLSEGVEVERRLAGWWVLIHMDAYDWDQVPTKWSLKQSREFKGLLDAGCESTMFKYLRSLPAPPRILGIRYEYLLKGSRYADKDLAARFGLNVWAQRSHLIRAYHSGAGADAGQWCWSYDFLKDDGGTSKLYYKTWRPRAVWESMSMKSWIDMLDASTEAMSAEDSTIGLEPRPLGWHSDAQAQGYTTRHPLDEVFPAPLTIYRSDDQLRDWIEQVEASEVRVAEAVARITAAADDGEKRRLLNVLMPQTRTACSYSFGTECQFVKVCYGGDDIRSAPLDSGLFRSRTPNHPQETTQEVVRP